MTTKEVPPVRTASPLPTEQFPRRQEPPRSFARAAKSLLILVLLGAGAYAAYVYMQQRNSNQPSAVQKKKGGLPKSVPVSTAAASSRNLPIYLEGLGSVTAYNTVTVKSRVDGQITKINFQEGQFVKQGDLLIEIDPRPFEVQLAQANGQLARDMATLNNAKAMLQRSQALVREGLIAREQFETQSSAVAQSEGVIVADQAAIDTVKLQLTFTKITAPISGRVGLRQVDLGNLVRANDTAGLLMIAQLQPIAVLFNLPEDNLSRVLPRLRGGQKLTVLAYDRDKQSQLAQGTLLTVDNTIDQTTGTARFKAVFDNEKYSLFPNQFVNVRLLVETRSGVVTVPSVAVQKGPQGTYVYVVGPERKAGIRAVTTGPSDGDLVAIETGLQAGEQVVIDGMDKLQEGMAVTVAGDNAKANRPAKGKGKRP